MGKSKVLRWILKITVALISFVLIFMCIQPVFVPKFLNNSTTMVDGFSYLKKNSLDVLCLGSSGMFCTIDAGRLKDEYHIEAYDYGSSMQTMDITDFYLRQALKTQHPKVIVIEIGTLFSEDDSADTVHEVVTWSYSPMPASAEKFDSLKELYNNDTAKALEYTCAPLFLYHDRWNSLGTEDFLYPVAPQKYIDFSARGYTALHSVNKYTLAYYDNSKPVIKSIPSKSQKAVKKIVKKCSEENIKVVFFKSPSTRWTKSESLSVKKFMKDNYIEFIDLNEHAREIGIDGNSDFHDPGHLNVSGAKKATDYMAIMLQKYLAQ